nr:hypothetical protein 26 [bacterium]
MSLASYDLDTDLSAVNSVLGAIGQSPVTKIEYDNPEISFIVNILNETNRDVQNEGWVYNLEEHYPLKPDADGSYYVPDNVLRMDICDGWRDRRLNLITRQGRLYDKNSHSYTFADGVLYFDIVWLYEFWELPNVFKRYITSKASTRAATQLVGNPELAKMLSTQEAFARAACVEYECNQGNFTMLQNPNGTTSTSYMPYQGLDRLV